MIKVGQKYVIKYGEDRIEVEVIKIFRQGEIWLKGENYNNIVTLDYFREITGKDPGIK